MAAVAHVKRNLFPGLLMAVSVALVVEHRAPGANSHAAGPDASSSSRHGAGAAAGPPAPATQPARPRAARPAASTQARSRRRSTPRSSSSTAPAATTIAARRAGCRSSTSTWRRPASHADVAEKMIRKLRAGMMPPAGARRPDEAALAALVTRSRNAHRRGAWKAISIPARGRSSDSTAPSTQRAVRDLLDLNVDVTPFLPPDSISNGFDNVADAQSFSPTLMEGYLRAASRITALAAGDATAPAGESNYKPPKTASQLRRVDGAPVGTRGGISVHAHVPGRRRLHLPDGSHLERLRRAVWRHRRRRTTRSLDRRRARRAHRDRSRA